MTKLNLNKEEKKRIKKISDAIDYHVTGSVKEHFNKAGKYEAFAQAATEDEKNAQLKAVKGLLGMSELEADLAVLKTKDIFMSVARRVGTDQELAALLPPGVFDKQDADVLEKCELKSLATLVRARL